MRYDILIIPAIRQYLGKPGIHQQLASRQAEHLPAPRLVAYSPEMSTQATYSPQLVVIQQAEYLLLYQSCMRAGRLSIQQPLVALKQYY